MMVIAYVPVLHAGYVRFFQQFEGRELGILAPSTYDLQPAFQKLGREIRALSPQMVCQMVECLQVFSKIWVLEKEDLTGIAASLAVVMPDEDVSHFVAREYLRGHRVEFVSVFLRFDLQRTLTRLPPTPDTKVALDEQLGLRFGLVENEAKRSPDWWRQVGAVCARPGGRVLYSAHNRHMPSEHSLYALGDPRNNFLAGVQTEMSCAHHAERSVIAHAARDGTSLLGTHLFVNTFPCPACAYSIIHAGIARVYYTGGYSALEAAEALRVNGVELVQVVDQPS